MENFPWKSMEFHGIPWRFFTRGVTFTQYFCLSLLTKMGHYGCNDLLSILSSVYSAFFTDTGEPTIVSATLRNTPQNNTHRTTHRRTNNGFCNTKKHSTRQYQHNNTQANQQWFPQHQETLHKTIPTQQHTGEPTIASTTLRNTPQNNTRTTTHRPTNNSFYNTKKHSTKQ